MKTAVVVGMQSEANIVGQRPDTVVIVGAGDAAKLAADLQAAIAGGCDRVLSFGTCGALDPVLEAGAIVVGWSMTGPALTIPCDRAWASSLAAATGGRVVVATVATSTVATAADKAALFAQTKACVVDFESYVAARVAWDKRVPFAMLRAVSDTADQDIPPAALTALDAGGGIDVWAVIDSLAGDDAQLPALLRLADSSTLAFNALAKALADAGVDYGETA
jgi:hypothetical protein